MENRFEKKPPSCEVNLHPFLLSISSSDRNKCEVVKKSWIIKLTSDIQGGGGEDTKMDFF